MDWKNKHEDCNQDRRSCVADVRKISSIGDPLEEVSPSKDEDWLPEEPEEDEEAEAGQDGPLVTGGRPHRLVVTLHRVSDLLVTLDWNENYFSGNVYVKLTSVETKIEINTFQLIYVIHGRWSNHKRG